MCHHIEEMVHRGHNQTVHQRKDHLLELSLVAIIIRLQTEDQERNLFHQQEDPKDLRQITSLDLH